MGDLFPLIGSVTKIFLGNGITDEKTDKYTKKTDKCPRPIAFIYISNKLIAYTDKRGYN